MRAVSFVKRLQWDLPGTVCRHGLTIGDVDNDGDNELVVGTAEGELYIFKGSELWQKIPGLGLVTSVAIGDIFNYGRNALVVICGDGWAHIFYSPRSVNPSIINVTTTQQSSKETVDQDNIKSGYASVDVATGVNMISSQSLDQIDGNNEFNELSGKMECVHVQRIPTNTKVVLVADVDKDGANEMILGLTDRVVRSYRWSSNLELGRGKLVGLNKWECANQIGTVTLQHMADGTPTLLVAQPGGTFMRIKCNPEDCHLEDDTHQTSNETAASCVDYQTLGISRMRNQNISTEIMGNLESTVENKVPNYEFKEPFKQNVSSEIQHGKNYKTSSFELKRNNNSQSEVRKSSFDSVEGRRKSTAIESSKIDKICENSDPSSRDQVDGNIMGGNVILGDYDIKSEKESLLPTYKDFSSQDNSNVECVKEKAKTEADSNVQKYSLQGKPYALATLDGTIMLVKDEVILWSMQVDHQIFALCRLDVTGDGSDEIVACAWDGQTYILDQQRNSVRFQFEEPVRAFCTGNYNVTPGISTPCLVYNSFNNKIFLYYDVTLPSMVTKPLNPMEELGSEERNILDELLENCTDTERQQRMQQFTEWLLYRIS
ncbi:PREDICTED: integrin-alpha FG-GAP repeat-containing protein 2-like [Habropoda laboriosa]|uniref:integrin-alpha FG-GAP repeat-containing protein 2-like n=1 Tax=Habropoda laboriosa TaxID=597456 RepID=UPI00083CF433|nr:PREDICTED: integrin-alpha FG-GAP repeat-containing protein 2-like [Habropoda laboriosa]